MSPAKRTPHPIWESKLFAALLGIAVTVLITITSATLWYSITTSERLATLEKSDEEQTKRIDWLRDYVVRHKIVDLTYTFEDDDESL